MPTTALYVVAASVIAPGVLNPGPGSLNAHLFIFCLAVMSAIPRPVALAGCDPAKTSVESFKIGHIAITAVVGVHLSSCAVQGWFVSHAGAAMRVALLGAGLSMIAGGRITDALGLGIAALLPAFQKRLLGARDVAHGAD